MVGYKVVMPFKDPKARAAYLKQYNKDHREKHRMRDKQKYQDHREERLAYAEQYRKDHREERKQ